MESKGLFWWARGDSNARLLPCQGSAWPQIAAGSTANHQDTGNQSGPQLAHGQRLGTQLAHAFCQEIILRASAEFRFAAYRIRAHEHARQFGEAVRG